MDYIIIALVACFTSLLTFFSGFGLGTVLTPVFILFFPIDIAIALTAIVHLFNNIFKFFLVKKYIDFNIVLRFGLPAILAAFFGAWLLLKINNINPLLFEYQLFGHSFKVFLLNFLVAILLFIFALIEIIPFFKKLKFNRNLLPLGGFLSGFFGGLTGNQGALRSAFLINAGLTKEVFVGTTILISLLVDFVRLGVYAKSYNFDGLSLSLSFVTVATLSAIFGSFLGNKLLKKVTLDWIQRLVAFLLLVFSLALGTGWI